MARATSSARRYAEAGFEIALRDGTLEEWRTGFGATETALGDERVARVAHSPTVSPVARRDLIAAAAATPLPQAFANLLLVLLQRRRIQLLPQIAGEFQRLADRRAGITRAVVTSAAPLDDPALRSVCSSLEEIVGGPVEITSQVDRALIGGLLVRIGDRIIDGSVRGRLERLRGQLTAGVL
jgi:F-type H+-transporting ATPase subunit delta